MALSIFDLTIGRGPIHRQTVKFHLRLFQNGFIHPEKNYGQRALFMIARRLGKSLQTEYRSCSKTISITTALFV